MKRTPALLAALMVALLASTGTFAAADDAEELAANVKLQPCLAVAADDRPIWPTTSFPASGKRFTCAFRLGEGESFETLTSVWTAVDVGEAAPPNTEIARMDLALKGSKRGRLRYTQDGLLPVGRYRLDVLADGEPWGSLELEVVEDQAPIPLDQPSELFPLIQGRVWQYAFLQEAGPAAKINLPADQLDEKGRLSATVTMKVVEQQEPGMYLRVERDGELMSEEWWTLAEKGLSATQRRVGGELIQLNPPQLLLPRPERLPMLWLYQARGRILDQQGQLWGPLPIAGPDGEQPGYLVVTEQGIPKGRLSAERHFIPGVGMTREVITTSMAGQMVSRQKMALQQSQAGQPATQTQGTAAEAATDAHTEGEDYYPLATGHKWVYEAQVNGRAAEVTKQVTRMEAVGDRQAYVVRHEGLPGMMKTLHLHQAADGVQAVKMRVELREPIPWVKYPLRPGATWTGRLITADGQDGGTLTFTVEASEEVTVPAGTFKAVPIRMVGETAGPALESRVWLAPNLGEVKRTVRLSQEGKAISESTLSLKQFQPGGK